MSATASVHRARRRLTEPLAPRAFAERRDLDDNGFDRWVAGWWHRARAGGVRRSGERLLAAIGSREASLRALGDAALRDAAALAAWEAYTTRSAGAAAAVLAPLVEAARRTTGLVAHPPQRVAAWALLTGRMVELDTGEGKTLTAALAAAAAALAGVPTHVVTVNDYLAQRDADSMRPLFALLGLSLGIVHGGVDQSARAEQYARAVTYCTNKDVVFDYLRDRVAAPGSASVAQLAVRRLHGHRGEPLRLRGLHYAIVDEADSILVDEARTPLILSAQQGAGADNGVWDALLSLAAELDDGSDYRLDGEHRTPELLDAGRRRLQAALDAGRHALPADWRLEWVREHYATQALRALHVLRRDEHYVVVGDKVVIVDEFTGRLLPDRSWEQGLHQLVEAKEGLAPSGRNRTLARLTYQTFFARYLRLAGMSGTLREVARELGAVYRTSTLRVEPNRPCRRVEQPTLVVRDAASKCAAVVAEVRERLAAGQAVLVGTRSVRASQALSAALTAAGVAHRVLNALQDADEAMLVASAGEGGTVTVATNMAGRGTDIRLSPEVVAAGGLHVVLTEWHESARIDRQLYGRCARQGDPGSCRAIVALDDELIERFGAVPARVLAPWASARGGVGEQPFTSGVSAAVIALRRLVQSSAEAANAAQRRATMRQNREMRRQLAFSGIPE